MANFIQKTDFDPAVLVPELMWNFVDETFYGYVTGVNKWVQVSSGSLKGSQGETGASGVGETGLQGATGLSGDQGETGPSGVGETGLSGATGLSGETGAEGTTGLGNFIQKTDFDPAVLVPELMWNFVDEVFYGYVTGVNKWVQVSSGPTPGEQGETGAEGTAGAQGETGAEGTAGSQGETGAEGTVGSQGETGAEGTAGSQGETGSQGVTGLSGGAVTDPSYNSVTITGNSDGSSALVLGILYGTSLPPSTSGLAYGTIYIQYVD